MSEDVRIDKYLWAVRLFKTRSMAAQAIKAGQVMLNEAEVKAAATVSPGDVIQVKRNPIWRSYKVLQLLKNRVGAKLVPEYLSDVTPAAELEKLELMKLMPGYEREKGKGRPTKKERRRLDDLGW